MARIYALIAQLDRVQVSEACGVGSSPAERTIASPSLRYTLLFFIIVLFLTRHKPIFLLGLFFHIAQNTRSI